MNITKKLLIGSLLLGLLLYNNSLFAEVDTFGEESTPDIKNSVNSEDVDANSLLGGVDDETKAVQNFYLNETGKKTENNTEENNNDL